MDMSASKKICLIEYPGVVPYEQALRLQQSLAQARAENAIPDALLLLQHPPVFTLGRFRGREEIIASPELLSKEGIEVVQTNRGGSITYHGPGQLVGYPIFNLKNYDIGVREYIWELEEVIIRLLAGFGIQSQRVAEFSGGVWVGEEKICSIGIHVSHYITMHGFALNVNTNLRHFEFINPCGIKGAVMTSLSKLLGRPVEVEALIEPLLDVFADEFGIKYEWGLEKCLATLDARNG